MPSAIRLGFLGAWLALFIGGLSPWGGGGQAWAEPYRLGFSGKDLPGQGVLVLAVTPGSPATRLYRPGNPDQPITLTAGDLITAVDGTPVRSLAEYYQAMNAATSGKVRITVRDASNGRVIELATTAARDGNNSSAKIYFLLIADTNAERIGKSVRADLDNISTIIIANVPKRQHQVIKLVGDQVSRENVLQKIGGLAGGGLVAGRDILVIYYSGHGAYSLKAADHMMTTSNGILYFRNDIERAVNQVRPRATAILSDACGVLIMGEPRVGAPSIEEPQHISPLFESLFLDLPPGVTAISAAKKGQTAGCNPKQGGYFTSTLCSTMYEHIQERLRWSDVLREVNAQIKELYPTNQVAYIVGSAGGSDPPPRFGVVAEGTPRGRTWHGVEVTRVLNGYPGQAMHRRGEVKTYALVAGRDVIQRINGTPVSNYAEFVNAVRNSPAEMSLTVYDLTSGQADEFEVTLRD